MPTAPDIAADLLSDTLSKPTPQMREAMAGAEVGDDVFGEDPTLRALEERVAALLGHERALFTPSGSMANQLAVRLHARLSCPSSLPLSATTSSQRRPTRTRGLTRKTTTTPAGT